MKNLVTYLLALVGVRAHTSIERIVSPIFSILTQLDEFAAGKQSERELLDEEAAELLNRATLADEEARKAISLRDKYKTLVA